MIRLHPEAVPDHRAAYDRLRADGINVNFHYIAFHLQPYYRDLAFAPDLCSDSEGCYREAVLIPLRSGLTEEKQERVIEAVRAIA